jgi:4,5-dihydroxyphthalate decarboxylase
VYQKDPWIAEALYAAFEEAKAQSVRAYRMGEVFFSPALMIPWLGALQAQNRDLMGEDPWPYGIEPNRKTLETYLRYHYEQGLSGRHFRIDEIFVPVTAAPGNRS